MLVFTFVGCVPSTFRCSDSAQCTYIYGRPAIPGLVPINLVAGGLGTFTVPLVGLFGLRGSGAELVSETLGGLHKDVRGSLEVAGRRCLELPAAGQPLANLASCSARSVRSQVKSGSSRPKWP